MLAPRTRRIVRTDPAERQEILRQRTLCTLDRQLRIDLLRPTRRRIGNHAEARRARSNRLQVRLATRHARRHLQHRPLRIDALHQPRVFLAGNRNDRRVGRDEILHAREVPAWRPLERGDILRARDARTSNNRIDIQNIDKARTRGIGRLDESVHVRARARLSVNGDGVAFFDVQAGIDDGGRVAVELTGSHDGHT